MSLFLDTSAFVEDNSKGGKEDLEVFPERQFTDVFAVEFSFVHGVVVPMKFHLS